MFSAVVSAEITTSGIQAVGRVYTLICSFTGKGMPATYQWSRIGADVEVLQSDSELQFTPLHLSDAGYYSCNISGVLDNTTMDTITYSNSKGIIIQGEKLLDMKLYHLFSITFSPSSILCYNHK